MAKVKTHCKVYSKDGGESILVEFSKIPNFLYSLVALNIPFEHYEASGENIVVVGESMPRLKNLKNNF